ncbi:Membrane protein implicated in regulation of membrane protease activity [Natronoarchaeum philippinense]|uniref:Membrane protein implicated in regulation of membrane protease activity n=1 Tax=Natronoarchaeum philippinense TaxID=558529 RepID=A0A285NUX1_NATPI|nr:NfeD family protein [Natronoarchaeum philippinense]SNZ13292.1 Membrane protein implicated in regulation of membrane protease activity [Natronoarchaeum philippinense]
MVLEAVDPPLLLVIAGIVLLVMEAMAPGAHLIVLGVALLFAGLLGMALTPLASPLALAGLVILFGAVALWVYREFDFYGGKGTAKTSDSDSLKGQIGRVTERVTATDGQVKLEDGGFNPFFQARAFDDPIPEGSEVIVVDPGGGNVLTVDSMEEFDEDRIDRELARDSQAEAGTQDDGAETVDEETRSADDDASVSDADTTSQNSDTGERDVETEEAG